jgi:hypothetical protein
MTKPDDKPPEPNRPISPLETREWRAEMLSRAGAIEVIAFQCKQILSGLLHHFTAATHFKTTITSVPLASSDASTFSHEGDTMPETGIIAPNSAAHVVLVPLDEDDNPKELDGPLQVTCIEPAAFSIDSTDLKALAVDCQPPDDIDAQPITHMNCTDVDNDPNVDLEFNWQKAIVIIKNAVKFGVTITSVPKA